MSMIAVATSVVERLPLPDALTRAGIDYLVGRTRRKLTSDPAIASSDFIAQMSRFPIAVNTDEANAQHYEVPAAFFGHILGPRRKYSSCFYDGRGATLAQAEIRALEETCAHADLKDGQTILELGCGWGSLSLWMAQHYPKARITAVSNSASQRAHIENEAARQGFSNLTVITADMNVFDTTERFERIVSVEMFEHMSNWQALLGKARGWLVPDGRLFLHVFTHRSVPYRFAHEDKDDWIAQHFFTGGIMPSHDLLRGFGDLFTLEEEWRWSGEHYARTANDWLANFDANDVEIDAVLVQVYGADAALWRRRWRLFFLATAGLFGHDSGETWGVSHYRLRPSP